MVLCIAKPTPACSCLFAALTIAVATAMVCFMGLFQASITALANGQLVPMQSSGRIMSHDLAVETAFVEAVHWEIRNSSMEMQALMASQMASLNTQLMFIRQDQIDLREAATRQRAEIIGLIESMRKFMQRDHNRLREDVLNTTIEQSQEIADMLEEELKSLERIKLRGSDRRKEKKRSAMQEQLLRLFSVNKDKDKESKAESSEPDAREDPPTTPPPTPAPTPAPPPKSQKYKRSAITDSLLGLLSSITKEEKKSESVVEASTPPSPQPAVEVTSTTEEPTSPPGNATGP